MNPREFSAMALRRASGLVGAARKTGARFDAAHFGEVFGGFFNDEVGDEYAVGSGG